MDCWISLQLTYSYASLAGEVQENRGTWRERLHRWKEILREEKSAGQLDSMNTRYVVEFDMKEVENSLRKDVVERVTETQGSRGLWISKRWWRYRPKLPYTYFLHKIDCSEVKCYSPSICFLSFWAHRVCVIFEFFLLSTQVSTNIARTYVYIYIYVNPFIPPSPLLFPLLLLQKQS